MASDSLPILVLDTCLYIHFLANQDREIADRVAALIQANGIDHEIILPSIVHAECAGVARTKLPKTKDTVKQRRTCAVTAQQFFEQAGFLFAEADQRTTSRAIELVIEHDIYGADATILATAELCGASHLYTVDNGLLKVGDKVNGLSVEKPPPPSSFVFPAG